VTQRASIIFATLLVLGATALPARALDIYEPDGPFSMAPSQALSETPGREFQAQVAQRGAELINSNPRFANVVVLLDTRGRLRSDVYVNLKRVLSLPDDDGTRAQAIATRINEAHAKGFMRPDRVTPARRDGCYVLLAGGDVLLKVEQRLASKHGTTPSALVLRWLDALRVAVGGTSIQTAASRGGLGTGTLVGRASWYGPGFHGRRAASGERFDQNEMTAAHKTLPFGTILLVTNVKNKRSCLVRINDRGPYIPGRMLDLSAAAARVLNIDGVGSVRVDILQP
jgi:rare lipoprotein A